MTTLLKPPKPLEDAMYKATECVANVACQIQLPRGPTYVSWCRSMPRNIHVEITVQFRDDIPDECLQTRFSGCSAE